MPLEGLDAYDSDSGASSQSSNSMTVPKSPSHVSDSNATEADSIDEQSDGGRSDDTRPRKNPSGGSVPRPVG